jgi:peptidoglycan/xylan/chitin deacetylase (PgdA/CDA1 family)
MPVNLLVVAYHRARGGPDGNPPAMLDAHFAHLARRCACVVPGEPLEGGKLNVCLTFDDAYFDFYSVVFPLLQRYKLKALLAVPTALVAESARLPDDVRTNGGGKIRAVEADQHFHCTWQELAAMAASGRVVIAAHGLFHERLDCKKTDLDAEIILSRKILATRLSQPVDSFVFPYGRFSSEALRTVKQHYRYAFRIGGALNSSWSGRLIYRVNGDCLAAPDALFSPARLARFRANFYWNRLRGR